MFPAWHVDSLPLRDQVILIDAKVEGLLRSSAQEQPELRCRPRSALSHGPAPSEDSLGWVYSSCSHQCRSMLGGASPLVTSRVLEGDSREVSRGSPSQRRGDTSPGTSPSPGRVPGLCANSEKAPSSGGHSVSPACSLAAVHACFSSCSCAVHNLNNCTLAAPGAWPHWVTVTPRPCHPLTPTGSPALPSRGQGALLMRPCSHTWGMPPLVPPAAFLSEAGRDKALPTALWEISTAEIRCRQVQESQGPQGTCQWNLGCLWSTVKV